MPDEPLRLTQDEMLQRLADRSGARLVSVEYNPERRKWVVLYSHETGGAFWFEGDTLPGVASEALGREVVARDDTAELVEALEAVLPLAKDGYTFREANGIAREGHVVALDVACAALAKWKERQ